MLVKTSLELNGRPRRALGVVFGLVLLVELDLLVVEDHIAALHPSVLHGIAHHVEGVTGGNEQRGVLARLERTADVVDARMRAVDSVKARTACSYSRP